MAAEARRTPSPLTAQLERAWHLLTVLFRLGRPASAAELASKCALPPSPSPDHVEFLCRIPGSPLFLTDDELVTVSEAAMVAFSGFLARANAPAVPKVAVRVTAHRMAPGHVAVTYSRKRNLPPLHDELVLEAPVAKKRLMLDAGEYVKNLMRGTGVWGRFFPENTTKNALQVEFKVADILNNDVLLVGTSSMQIPSCHLPPPLCSSNTVISSFEFEKIGCLKHDKAESFYENPQGIGVHKVKSKDDNIDVETNSNISKALDLEIPVIRDPEVGPDWQYSMMDKPNELERQAGTLTAKHSRMVSQISIRNEVKSNDIDILGTKKKHDVFFTEVGSHSGCVVRSFVNAETTGSVCSQGDGASCEMKSFMTAHQESASIGPDQIATKLKDYSMHLSDKPGVVCKKLTMSKLKATDELGFIVGLQSLRKALCNQRDSDFMKWKEDTKGAKLLLTKQKKTHSYDMTTKDKKVGAAPAAPKSQGESKLLPSFEFFFVEEEEGSGGYGTVYKVQRKVDGKTFAVKCPHANAHLHHVNNEMKMLERFGGRNFVIKYEGSFRSGNLDCFVLEHVEHDRPEVLKKEINVYELQWYGYCMFRALSSLHKQGIAHRDVKPGNFLFSRKLNKGYLIDFNLASDLHQKFFKSSKLETNSKVMSGNGKVSLSSMKPSSCNQAKKALDNRTLECSSKETANETKKWHISSNARKRPSKSPLDPVCKVDKQSKCVSQAADVSGITSTKDPTSSRAPSADRLKQPIPCKGRKELINFLHEAMQSPNQKDPIVPASQRKRIAAPSGKVDKRLLILTPMPLHSGGNAVAGAGMLKNMGNRKHKREGPCVGTKGFRAPEVLFKSFHQGCKVDIWSAGVTLLYLMIGRTPFGGDPEQNIKEIAKLRGSEDLWEVAKVHNCESSYPLELFDVRSVQSIELKEWCALNTRRLDFLDKIPQSLFDLVDKCLTVNPRRRISADEALMHEFFAPCHKSLRKQRMLRRAAGSVSGTSSS